MATAAKAGRKRKGPDKPARYMFVPADLRRAKGGVTLEGPKHFPGSKDVGKRRGTVKNTDKPQGQIALFLNKKLERLGWSPEDFARALDKAGLEDKTHEAVRKWLNGSNAPRLTEMDTVATVLGYDDWYDLVAAVAKFNRRKS